MIVAAFALDRFDDDGADVDLAPVDELTNLSLRFLFALDHIRFALRFGQREIDVRTQNARPIEFSEQIRLARIGIGETHRVAAAAVKRVSKMQNLRAALPMTGRHVLANFPIHRRFQTIFDRKRAAFDKQIAFQRAQTDHALERFHKFGVAFRVNIRVRDFDFRRTQKIALNFGLVEVRMIKSDWHRAEESVEIDEPFARHGVVQIGAATFVEIDDDLETIEQNVLLDRFENTCRRYRFWFFALWGAASR